MLKEEAAGWLIISLREKLCFREVLTLKPACAQQINQYDYLLSDFTEGLYYYQVKNDQLDKRQSANIYMYSNMQFSVIMQTCMT